MNELTVEKIKEAKRTTDHGLYLSYSIDHEEIGTVRIIDFLLLKLSSIEHETAKKCAEIAKARHVKPKNPGYEQGAFFCAESIVDEIVFTFNLGG